MPTDTAPILTITEDGTDYHPAEYAGFWGDGSNGDGCAYYNVSRQARPGVVIANPDHTPDDWRNFARIVRADLARVREAIASPAGREATGWDEEDARNHGRCGWPVTIVPSNRHPTPIDSRESFPNGWHSGCSYTILLVSIWPLWSVNHASNHPCYARPVRVCRPSRPRRESVCRESGPSVQGSYPD